MQYVAVLIYKGQINSCYVRQLWDEAVKVAIDALRMIPDDIEYSMDEVKYLIDLNGVYEANHWSLTVQEARL